MPCYDSRGNEPRIIYRDGADPQKLIDKDREVNQWKERSMAFEGLICAIFSELESRGIMEDVAVKSSRNGLIDVMGVWSNHKKDDESRIANKIHKELSTHEQQVAYDILKKRFD